MQWPVYKVFRMESFGVRPVRRFGEEELCFLNRESQWFEARSRWVKVEESRLRVENEQAFDAAVKTCLISAAAAAAAAAAATAVLAETYGIV